jgi:geranylgeranyl diphosphate synthase type II
MRSELGSHEASEYLAPALLDYPNRPGKGIRPALMLATCEAFGGLVADAIPSAVALELLHNAFLIHDDIEDGGLLRRGGPTLHEVYGIPMAIHAGDALALRAMGALRANVDVVGSRLAREIYHEFDFMAQHTADGQATDLGWRQDNRLDLTPDDYLDLMMKKTGWYTTVLPLRVGAMIGSRGAADLKPMIDFGFYLGAAFQIQDDVLNLVGDPDVYGKERYGDIREAKRTLMVIHLNAVAEPAATRWLCQVLAPRRERTEADIAAVVELMDEHGSIGFAREFARGVANSAQDAFERAFGDVGDSPGRRLIAALIPYMVDRSV